MDFFESGFEEFENLLSEYTKKAENVLEILEVGAKEFVNDVKRLPKPRSRMSGAGYTHLLDTVTYRKNKDEIETGWGKYYGPMLERGTIKMKGTPHLSPTFDLNKDKYYKKMTEKMKL